MPDFSSTQWMLVVLAAFSSGVSKAGLPGVGLLGVALMAAAIPGRASTGVVLPLLIFADMVAASTFRHHVDWRQIRRLAVPICLGVVLGWFALMAIPDVAFRPIIGVMVVGMLGLQLCRQWFPRFDAALPHSTGFVWVSGVLAGVATMVANAAGPITSAYLIILALPKLAFIHTSAWLFLFVNLFKVPFGVQLGIINAGSLTLNLRLVPAVLVGMWVGKRLTDRISQVVFQWVIIGLTLVSAAWLLGLHHLVS